MNCLWQDIPDSTDERGWRKTTCQRCGHKTLPWPREHVHYRDCTGAPLWHEWGHWLEIVLQVFGITKARWQWLIRKPACGCQQRAEVLNTWGQKLRGISGRIWYNSHKTKE